MKRKSEPRLTFNWVRTSTLGTPKVYEVRDHAGGLMMRVWATTGDWLWEVKDGFGNLRAVGGNRTCRLAKQQAETVWHRNYQTAAATKPPTCTITNEVFANELIQRINGLIESHEDTRRDIQELLECYVGISEATWHHPTITCRDAAGNDVFGVLGVVGLLNGLAGIVQGKPALCASYDREEPDLRRLVQFMRIKPDAVVSSTGAVLNVVADYAVQDLIKTLDLVAAHDAAEAAHEPTE